MSTGSLNSYAMRLSLSHASWVLIIWLLIMVASPFASHAQEAFERSLQVAVRLYESLEYEQALEQIQKARRLSRGIEQEVAVYLHEGIILGDMGQQDQSRAAFKKGLLLSPHAKLPLKVSPKLERDFEKERAEARKELGIDWSPPAPAIATNEDRPVAPAVSTPNLTPTPFEPRPEQQVRLSIPVAPVVLAAAGVVAAGAGSWLGVQSRARVSDARSAPFQDEARARLDDARSSARLANVLFGTAGVALSGALVTWLMSSTDTESSPKKETP